MNIASKIYITIIFFSCSLIYSCKKKKDDDTTPQQEFDRAAMLANLANNIILPNYAELKLRADSFDIVTSAFIANPDSSKLLALHNASDKLYKAWQLCSVFELGQAETEVLRASLNTFPTDTTQINSNISSGTYNLSSAANIDAKGLPAIDYLLFKHNISNTLYYFTAHTHAANRKIYLSDLSAEIKNKITNVYNSWNAGYTATFASNTGTDIGSSTGILVNQLTFDLEIIKNAKVGIPLGKKTLGIPVPDKTEAYYRGNSAELALLNLTTLENIFLGKDASANNRIGFDDYLLFLNAQYNGTLLADKIKSQFTIAKNKLQLVADPLSNSVVNDYAVVDSAYVNIQKLVVLLKTDMTSALGVQITYQDNDGD